VKDKSTSKSIVIVAWFKLNETDLVGLQWFVLIFGHATRRMISGRLPTSISDGSAPATEERLGSLSCAASIDFSRS
jgi:hypothetical protein